MSVVVWAMVVPTTGLGEALWAIPGSIGALVASYIHGARRDTANGIVGP